MHGFVMANKSKKSKANQISYQLTKSVSALEQNAG